MQTIEEIRREAAQRDLEAKAAEIANQETPITPEELKLPVVQRTCSNCQAFYKPKHDNEPGGCHLDPPKVYGNITGWPGVDEQDWCINGFQAK